MDNGRNRLNWKAQGDMPRALGALLADTHALGFDMLSDVAVGRLLRTLVASKPGGTMLELGTGTGLATAWMLDGLTLEAKLVSVDNDAVVQGVAARHLGNQKALTLCCAEAGDFVSALEPMQFDLIFADAWPGKFSHLDATLSLLREGGLYVVDDLLPQPNWPQGHQARVDAFVSAMLQRDDIIVARMDWATGMLVAARVG